jgi:hypothetical protein
MESFWKEQKRKSPRFGQCLGLGCLATIVAMKSSRANAADVRQAMTGGTSGKGGIETCPANSRAPVKAHADFSRRPEPTNPSGLKAARDGGGVEYAGNAAKPRTAPTT